MHPGSGAYAILHRIGWELTAVLGPDAAAQQPSNAAVAVAWLRDLAEFATTAADGLEENTHASQVGEACVTYDALVTTLSQRCAVEMLQDSKRFSATILGNLLSTVASD